MIPFHYDEEATIQDADIFLAQETAQYRKQKRAEAMGVCFHSASLGLSVSGKIFYPEQEFLVGSQVICMDKCGLIFMSDEIMEEDRQKLYRKYTGS